jgi:hypothetical protein
MAMTRVEPVPVRVRTDWLHGTPREISWGEQRLPVTRLVAVRDESAAFPAALGPRTVFELQTPLARLTVSYRHWSRRWTIDGLDRTRRAA